MGFLNLNPARRGNLLGALEVVVMKKFSMFCGWCGIETSKSEIEHSDSICEACGEELLKEAQELRAKKEEKHERN